ncbi:hypothetical protein SAMN05192550_1325 [Flavobacterium glycines]|uniref:Uncharacterized protein n=1 Tax=Flavobacterium glycines TaxID=551990 RepID=A0A1B9DRA9_9FLAO|nr:hypothetical protein [Flavobacterium glycines]OCB72213.1 hypothetical protein FBGL_05970 [Flavobacterium glycines]GEL09668.1 hypothetical protein FGL01_04070 [Flavobacterium glycines]SDI98136.1 hypothetical protein SAMN05192550_1325 [Flavobacterium glycines]
MTGILAQTIATVSYGNEYLIKNKTNEFYPQNSTFQHCNTVDFREIKKSLFTKDKEITVANNPIEWFHFLSKNGCQKLSLYYQSEDNDDYRTSAFVGGGGNWYIECIYKNYSDFWISNWKHNKEIKDKPWEATYGKSISKNATINRRYDVLETKNNLKNILEEIAEFAYKQTTENWGKIFESSKLTLESEKPEIDFYHTDLICWKNYELENRQLLMSASKALVFGGMGSWNDMWFEKEETEKQYTELSRELYKVIMKGIESSINTEII